MSPRALGITLRTLNILDALSTLYILQHGGTETNPVMAALLDVHPLLFLFVKVLWVGLCAAFLEHHARTKPLATAALYVATAGYTCLLGYHAAILFG